MTLSSHSTDATGAGGLFARGRRVSRRIPLRGVAIDVLARGAASRVTVAQRYQNDEETPIEAVYTFPLSETCAVCGFEAEIDGNRIAGRIEEREKAFEEYDDAMARGHGGFLVDQDRPDIFTASVGNLLPGQEVVIRLSYVSELEQSGSSMRLVIPTTISPRYVPPEMARDTDPAELDHLTPPTVLSGVPYGLKLTVDVEAAADLRAVSCPSHPAQVALDGRSARVELLGEDVQLDRDFVLEVDLAEPHEASAVVAREDDGTRVVMLNLFPDLSRSRRGPCEFVFIIDRSGSMGGDSIAQARRALQLCLRSMERGDRFNVVGFGSTCEAMFPDAVEYSQRSLDDATKRVDALDADLGGTELLAPLELALKSSQRSELPRMVVLLTDGQVANEAQCIELAGKHASHARVFTFGIGFGPSRHLVRGLARSSGGQAEFIHPNERIEPRVMRQFRRMASAHLRDVRIDWGKLECDLVAPCEPPPIFDGDRLTVYARLSGGEPCEVAVEAEGPEGRLRFPVTVDLETAAADPTVPALMARKAIEDLEERRGASARDSTQRNRREQRLRMQILELAMRYALMSSETSFVAVEEREEDTQRQSAELRRIPVALTKGWGGMKFGAGVVPCMAAPAVPAMEPPVMRRSRKGPGVGSAGGMLRGIVDALFDVHGPNEPEHDASVELSELVTDVPARGKPPRPASDELEVIVRAQRADGSFGLTEELARLAEKELGELARLAGEVEAKEVLARRIVATLVALRALESRFAARREEWGLLADKARRWLGAQKVSTPQGFESLEAWAEDALEPGKS